MATAADDLHATISVIDPQIGCLQFALAVGTEKPVGEPRLVLPSDRGEAASHRWPRRFSLPRTVPLDDCGAVIFAQIGNVYLADLDAQAIVFQIGGAKVFRTAQSVEIIMHVHAPYWVGGCFCVV